MTCADCQTDFPEIELWVHPNTGERLCTWCFNKRTRRAWAERKDKPITGSEYAEFLQTYDVNKVEE